MKLLHVVEKNLQFINKNNAREKFIQGLKVFERRLALRKN